MEALGAHLFASFGLSIAISLWQEVLGLWLPLRLGVEAYFLWTFLSIKSALGPGPPSNSLYWGLS